jgi:hypothetical protein
MPPKRKQNGGNRIHRDVSANEINEVSEIQIGSKKHRAFDASKGLTANLGMRARSN